MSVEELAALSGTEVDIVLTFEAGQSVDEAAAEAICAALRRVKASRVRKNFARSRYFQSLDIRIRVDVWDMELVEGFSDAHIHAKIEQRGPIYAHFDRHAACCAEANDAEPDCTGAGSGTHRVLRRSDVRDLVTRSPNADLRLCKVGQKSVPTISKLA